MLESLLVSLVVIEIVMSSIYIRVSCSWANFHVLVLLILVEDYTPSCYVPSYMIHTFSFDIFLFMHDSIFVILEKIDGLHCLWTIWHVMCKGRPSYYHVILIYDDYIVAQEIYS